MASNQKDARSPVTIDITASAKAGLEIKGEIPSKSLGGLVDSIVDVIRPFSERMGLRADQLRLQREDVLYDILTKSRRRLELEQKPLNQIPLKTIIPLLEKASIEERDSPLIDWWADLIASSSQIVGMQHPVYSDLLSRITSAEAAYLERMIAVSENKMSCGSHLDIEEIFRTEIASKVLDKKDLEIAQSARDMLPNLITGFQHTIEKQYCILLNFLYPAEGIKYYRNLDAIYVPFGRTYRDITMVLKATNILEAQIFVLPIPSQYIGETNCNFEILTLSILGRNLLNACKPNAFP